MAQSPGGSSSKYPPYSGDVSGGYYWNNLLRTAQFLMSNGYSRTSAAGIAGAIAGESSGDPEAQGTGGAGLIGWTPPSKAAPDQPITSGNPSADFDAQLTDILEYNNTNGPTDKLKSLKGDPVAASDFYSQQFERPLVQNSDVRAQVANNIYSALGRYKPNSAYTQYPSNGVSPDVGKGLSGNAPSGPSFGSIWRDALTGIGVDLGQSDVQAYNNAGQLDSLGGIAAAITTIGAPFAKIALGLDWLFHPNHWIRILAGVGGAAFLGFGVYSMTHVGRGDQVGGSVAGVPVGVDLPSSSLPLAIGSTGLGFLGLYVAFHNLPDSVGNFPEFVGYLAGEIRNPTGAKSG